MAETFIKAKSDLLVAKNFVEDVAEPVSTGYRIVDGDATSDLCLGSPEFTEVPWAATASGVYYAPLTPDAKFLTAGTWESSTDTGTLTGGGSESWNSMEGGVYVGTAITNLWGTHTGDLGFWLSAGSTSVSDLISAPIGSSMAVMTLDSGTVISTGQSSENDIGAITSGDYISVSTYYRQVSGSSTLSPTDFTIVSSEAGAAITSKTLVREFIPTTREKSWKWGTGSYLYSTTIASGYPYIKYSTTGTAVTRACGPQVEKKPFASTYTSSSLTMSTLTFDLNTTYSLDWSGDWTIIYDKKVHGTHDDTISGYNIDSLGRNGNTVGGGFIWWGKNTAADELLFTGRTATAVDWEDEIQYHWTRVFLRYESGVLKLRIFDENQELLHTDDYTFSIPTSNYYVTQNGYDLQLGGWDYTTNSSNSFYRDLIVLPARAMSDTEFESYFRANLKVNESEIMCANFSEDI